MAIYRPRIDQSRRDKRLIELISELLLQDNSSETLTSNIPDEAIALSEMEAEELGTLLDSLISSREFLAASYFVENLTSQDDGSDKNLREIFLSERKVRGRSRAMASSQWRDFQSRIWIIRDRMYAAPPVSMPFQHFLTMESRLFRALRVHPRIADKLMRLINLEEVKIEELRRKASSIAHGTIKGVLENIAENCRPGELKRRWESMATRTNLSAAIIIVANTSVLFTTRDWSVTGTISAMAGSTMSLRGK